ncbi:hypothetical protein OG21DRAFT_218725 [Imleria badia]|nr:hypothetical protein OG21DRAFT_218725 [Imleria badia]
MSTCLDLFLYNFMDVGPLCQHIHHINHCCIDHSSGNPYTYSIYFSSELGAIFTSMSDVVLALCVFEHDSPFPYVIPFLDVASQLALVWHLG